MKVENDKGMLGPLLFDVRVRERFLAKGVLDAKALERHLSELPDLESRAEVIAIEQPAIGAAKPSELDDGGPGDDLDEEP